jgi:hypothetical protein
MNGMLQTIRRQVLPDWTDYWLAFAATARTGKVLNLGSGSAPLSGVISVDINTRTKPDVICDLNRFPWPFADQYPPFWEDYLCRLPRGGEVFWHLRAIK